MKDFISKMIDKHTKVVLWFCSFIFLFIKGCIPVTSNPQNVLQYFFNIASGVFSSLGVAIIVSLITTYIKNALDYGQFSTKNEKLKQVKTLITSNENTPLDLYKQKFVENIFNLNSKYRDNVVYEAKFFLENDQVCAKTKMSYIENRSLNDAKFNEISVSFDTESSTVNYYKITNPNNVNNSVTIQKEGIKHKTSKAHGDSLIYIDYCKIPTEYQKLSAIMVEKEYTFIGQDHWISYAIFFKQPLTSLHFSLEVEDGLSIKEVTIIGNENLYSKNQTTNKVTLSCNNWLSHHNGFLIIISKV